GATAITGTADAVQLLVKGNATQTSSILALQNSAGTNQFSVSNAGAVTQTGALTIQSGGANITGNSTITGTLAGLTGLTVASGGAIITGATAISGTSDTIQLLVKGNVPQTTSLFALQNSSAANQFTVSNSGVVIQAGALTVQSGGINITGNSTITGT